MQTQGPSSSPASPRPWYMRFGIHITTFTMTFGLFNLFIKTMFFVIKKDNLLEISKSGYHLSTDNKYFAFLSLFSCWDFLYIIPGSSTDDLKIPTFLLLCTILITFALNLGVYGANPKLLLPLIFSQSTEMLLDIVAILKLRHYLPYMNVSFYQFLCPVIWKGYFVSVLWRCYNYLIFMERASAEPIMRVEPNTN